MTTSGQHPPVVTLASLYGAGGSVVGPRVAERLGVAFLVRAIPDRVAKQTVSEQLLDVAVGQAVPQVPADRDRDHLRREPEASEH
jgi:Cytidylate kinase-like family